jgi:bifunctional non-homologous end joining protein LigD
LSRASRAARATATSAARDRIPFRAKPMLATLVPEPFHRPGWVYEEKYDGYRILAYKEGRRVVLLSRNGKDRTESFSDVSRAIETLPDRTLLLDGEAVAFDRRLVSRFQLLQQGETPIVFAVFDCLYRSGEDLRGQPLTRRREELEDAIGRTERLFASRRLGSNGLAAFRLARKKGFEGMVGKNASSTYHEGRSIDWLKVKAKQEDEFVIGGYTPPSGLRTHFGALLLGAYRGSELRYVGKVGTGYTEKTLASLHRQFRPLEQKTPPFADPPREKGATWLAPRLVAQIAYQEWTADGKLRQPVFLGLRDDKKPGEVELPKRFA